MVTCKHTGSSSSWLWALWMLKPLTHILISAVSLFLHACTPNTQPTLVSVRGLLPDVSWEETSVWWHQPLQSLLTGWFHPISLWQRRWLLYWLVNSYPSFFLLLALWKWKFVQYCTFYMLKARQRLCKWTSPSRNSLTCLFFRAAREIFRRANNFISQNVKFFLKTKKINLKKNLSREECLY